MPFYTELPADKSGNRAFTNSKARVIEATLESRDIYGPDLSPMLEVVITEEFRWSNLDPLRWIEVEGPARTLTESQYIELLQQAGASEEHIQAAKINAGTD